MIKPLLATMKTLITTIKTLKMIPCRLKYISLDVNVDDHIYLLSVIKACFLSTLSNLTDTVAVVRWAGHVARMGRRGMHVGYWWESQKERDHWEDQDVGGWTISKWILREIGWDGVDWIDRAQDRDQ
jgi:hypothetical protein